MTKRRFKKGIQSIILTVIMVLTMVPIDSFTLVTKAANEEVTKTYSLSTYVRADDMLSFSLTDPDDNTSKTVFTADGDNYTHMIRKFGSGIQVGNTLSYDDSPNVRFWVLPNVNGKVTKIEFTKACRVAGQVIVGDHDAWPPTWEDTSFFMSIDGMKYNGTDEALTGDSHLDGKGNTTESENFTFISTDPEGIEGNLSLWLGKRSMFTMLSGCEIKIHYIPAAEPAHEHDFTYSMNGNTLTATCGHSDGRSCSLADSSHQISVSLEAEDAYYQFGYVYPATLLNNSLFASETGATIGNITYRNNTTGEDLGTQKPTGSGEHPTGAGDYTASVTINVGGKAYTLTKDYTLSNLYSINNSYPQFSFGTEKYSVVDRAAENEIVTITFTPQNGETLKSLSVKGETTNYSLGNGITKVDDTHYTFIMPAETVTIDASFTYNISIDNTIQHGSVTASVGTTENATTATKGDTVILNVTPESGYTTKSVSVNGTAIEPVEGVYSFTMPTKNVTVTAEFKRVFSDGIGERLTGYSVSLEGDIGVNFYMELDDSVAANENAYMQFTLPNSDTPKVPVSEAAQKTVGGKTYYVFKCNVSAKDMASEITAQMFDGDKAGTEYTYSVKDYADYLLERPEVEEYANAAPLVKAMLNYGAASQRYFKEGTAIGEVQDMTDVTVPNTFKFDETNIALPEGVTFEGATLSLKSETTLSLYFKGLPADTKFICDGKTVETAKNGEYVVARIRGIKASELENDFTVTFKGVSMTYNAMAYCYNVLNGDTHDEDLQNVCKALYLYAQAAINYAG